MTEPTILETDANGELAIPAPILGSGPHARYVLVHDERILRLIPEFSYRQGTSSPEERARAFRGWVSQLPKRKGPAMPAEALRRENFYD